MKQKPPYSGSELGSLIPCQIPIITTKRTFCVFDACIGVCANIFSYEKTSGCLHVQMRAGFAMYSCAYGNVHESVYVCVYMCMYQPNPSARARYDTRLVIKLSLIGLN